MRWGEAAASSHARVLQDASDTRGQCFDAPPPRGASPPRPALKHHLSDGVDISRLGADAAAAAAAPAAPEAPPAWMYFTMLDQAAAVRAKPRPLAAETARAAAVVGVLLLGSLLIVGCALLAMPDPTTVARQAGRDDSQVLLRIPRSFADLRLVKSTLDLYQARHFGSLLLLCTVVYLFMQTFVVPGCFFLNLLIGAFLPFFPGLLYITALTTLGCVCNYLLSRHVLAAVVRGAFSARVAAFKAAVAQHREHLFFYLLLLRIVPAFPSWAVNLACPLANIPLRPFALSTALGFQPQFVVFLNAGRTIGSLRSWRDLYSWQSVGTIVLCAALTLVPIFGKSVLPKAWRTAPPGPDGGCAADGFDASLLPTKAAEADAAALHV